MPAQPGRVSGKVALVTGAGSGIGKATVELLAAEGAAVIAADIDLPAVRALAVAILTRGGKATPIGLDVADESQWRQAIDATMSEHGRLDVLVNNAGISISKPATELAVHEWRKVFAVNIDGAFLGARLAIPIMRRRGGGSIVNVASVSGIKPSAKAAAYCASKAALRIFSKTLAIECADAKNGVRVNVVSPGGVKTPMWEKEEFFRSMMAKHGNSDAAFNAMAGELGSFQFYAPDDVARTILFLASDESSHLSGTEFVMDRGHTG